MIDDIKEPAVNVLGVKCGILCNEKEKKKMSPEVSQKIFDNLAAIERHLYETIT